MPPSKKKRNISKTAKAELVFPVARMHRLLKQAFSGLRIGAGAPVFLAATLEYIMAEILELSGNCCRDSKRRRIRPRDVFLAVEYDPELSKVFNNVILPSSGAKPCIYRSLVVSKKTKKPSKAKYTIKSKPKTKKAILPALVKSKSVGKKDAGSGMTILNEKIMNKTQKLTVLQGDIIDIVADAIVHPTSSNFFTGGEVGRRIAEYGGATFQRELTKLSTENGPIQSNSAVIGKVSTLRCSHVVHCNGPSWSSTDAVPHLGETVVNCLDVANQEGLKSIAFPSIGSGNAGFPKQLAAETILRAIKTYLATTVGNQLQQVYFVLYDKESVNVYVQELERLQ